MPILAAIPAAIGAGLAIKDALDTELGDNPGHESAASKARYAPAKGGLAGIHGDWQKLGNVADSSKQGVWDQRWNATQSRDRQAGALDQLGQYASGEKSAARLAATNAIDQSQGAMASQAAAAGDSPAAQRAAMYGSAAAGQNIAGGVAATAAQEQLAAQGAYLTGAGQMRSGDAASMGLEQSYLGQNRNFALGQQGAKLNALNLGMGQERENAARSMAYDAAVRNSLAGQQQAETAERGQNIGMINNTVSALGNAASGAATASDRSVKKGIAPATPDDVFGSANQAVTQGSAADFAAQAGARFDPNWQDLNSQENQDVFAGPYDQNWDAQAVQNMKDDRYVQQRTAALGQRQAQANAMTPQTPADQLYSGSQLSDVPDPHNPQYEKVSTLAALNNLQGFSDKPIPGTWGNSTLNSIQQLVGSDEKVKRGIKGLSDDELSHEVARRTGNDPVGALLDSIEAKKYRYKDPDSRGAAPGEHVGVMAQDLEKTPAGAALVSKDGPNGTRMVDYAKSGPLTFAALAQLNERMNRIEQKGGGEGPGAPYEPVVARRFAPEMVQRSQPMQFEPDPVYLSQDEPGAEARWGGMSPQGGPGAIQSSLADLRRAADTSAFRGQMGSDKLVKKGVGSLSDDELFAIVGRQGDVTRELDRRMGVGPGAEERVKLRRPGSPGAEVEPDYKYEPDPVQLSRPPAMPVVEGRGQTWNDQMAAAYPSEEERRRFAELASDKQWNRLWGGR